MRSFRSIIRKITCNYIGFFVSSLLCCSSSTVDAFNYSADGLNVVHLSIASLQSVGISPQIAQLKLPISCHEINGWGVTISRELLENYKKRGFSRLAVCLALGSDDVYFDPATGKQLPLYQAPVLLTGPRPLWLSDCFHEVKLLKSRYDYIVAWTPVGCKMRYDPHTGQLIKKPKAITFYAGGELGGGVDEDNNQSSDINEDRLRSLVNGR
jgi:hypothetical protein